MEKSESSWFLLLLVIISCSSAAAGFDAWMINSTMKLANYTSSSDFRMINRRILYNCPSLNPRIRVTVSPDSSLPDDGFVTVNVTGIRNPSKYDWVGMVTSAYAKRSTACPHKAIMYKQTGDMRPLPLLCHYPIKAQYLSSDPDYLGCKKWRCKRSAGNRKGQCIKRCMGTLSFHVVNIRTDIEFILFGHGFQAPCIRARSSPLQFANPKRPLYGHLSSVDSTGTSMKLTWVSGDEAPQMVRFRRGRGRWRWRWRWRWKAASSEVTTFTQRDMCTSALPSPAKDFGWHDPGFIHSAVMTGLKPSTMYTYRYGSRSAGWSDKLTFRTPPAAGADQLTFISYGDMGNPPRDLSIEHFMEPGAAAVVHALTDEVESGNVDSIFHIGDLSYATGFLVKWDYFLELIRPLASKLSYMTAIGNHESNYARSSSLYNTPDSGGECGVPYEKYFPMPTAGKDKPWYSIEQGPVHFTVISTEHDWRKGTEQYEWIKSDLASADRLRTPWLIFMGHRTMYSSKHPLFPDARFAKSVEPLLFANKVDLVLVAHMHVYERTCAVYQKQCLGMPVKDKNGIDTYYTRNYTAPVHAIIGMAGFKLEKFNPKTKPNIWSISRHSDYGYVRFKATKTDLTAEFVNANTRQVQDSFRLIK